jgi:hypothetical protein
MLELVLPQGTVMLEELNLKGCTSSTQTGWRFKLENGEPRACTATESHGTYANGHKIYNEGTPLPKLATFQDVKSALVNAGVLYVV